MLSFGLLTDDQPRHHEPRTNRDVIISCFESML